MTGGGVLVVGAGPVGLTVACELARQHVDVRVIDRQTTPSIQSRASVIWPRQLELLRRIGVASDIISAGHRLESVAFYSEGQHKGSVSLDRLRTTIHPFAITIPQNTTEEILAAKLELYGIEVERGKELLDIDDPDCGPIATIQSKSGETERSSFDWIIGADGAHSSVRRILSIPFTPTSTNTRFGICDVTIADGPSSTAMHYYYSRAGAIGLAPMRDGIYRIAMSIPAQSDDGSAPPAPSREDFQAALDARALGAGAIDVPAWAAAFEARFGTARNFRRGRCFLAGDSAHIMSPAGGQGMNTGLQDAVNLGWKLGAVIRDHAELTVLDTYDPERRAAALQVTRTTGMQLRLGFINGPVSQKVRDNAVVLANRTGLLQRFGAPIFSQLGVTYSTARRPLYTRALTVGDRIPAFAADSTANAADEFGSWPVLDNDTPTVLLWPGLDRWPRWNLFTRTVTASLPELACVDVGSIQNPHLAAKLGRDSHVFLCRPDGHLLMRSKVDLRSDATHIAEKIRSVASRTMTTQKEPIS